jgi:hypothetical protein
MIVDIIGVIFLRAAFSFLTFIFLASHGHF